MLIFAENGRLYTRTEGGEVIADFLQAAFPYHSPNYHCVAATLDTVHSSRKTVLSFCERIDAQMSTHFK